MSGLDHDHDWLDDLMGQAEAAPLPDGGFTGRVMAALPPRRRGRARSLVLLGSACASGLVLALPPALSGLGAAARALGDLAARPGLPWIAALLLTSVAVWGVTVPILEE